MKKGKKIEKTETVKEPKEKRKVIKRKRVVVSESDGSEEDFHDEICLVDGHGGKLLCCDYCARSLHPLCAGGTELTRKTWVCSWCDNDDYDPLPSSYQRYIDAPSTLIPANNTKEKIKSLPVTPRDVIGENISLMQEITSKILNTSTIPPHHHLAVYASRLTNLTRLLSIAHSANIDVRDALVGVNTTGSIRAVLSCLDKIHLENLLPYLFPEGEKKIPSLPCREFHYFGLCFVKKIVSAKEIEKANEIIHSRFTSVFRKLINTDKLEYMKSSGGGFDAIRQRGEGRYDLTIPELLDPKLFPSIHGKDSELRKLVEEILKTSRPSKEFSHVIKERKSQEGVIRKKGMTFQSTLMNGEKKKEEDDKENDTSSTTKQTEQKRQEEQVEIELVHAGCMISLPGCSEQPLHSDGPHLTYDTHLGCHALNVFLPCIDIKSYHGGTLFYPRSHLVWRSIAMDLTVWKNSDNNDDRDNNALWKDIRQYHEQETPLLNTTDALLFDYRVKHKGLPNFSNEDRPIIYLTFTRKNEWCDVENFTDTRYKKLSQKKK